MSFVIWLLSVLVIAAPDGLVANVESVRSQKKNKDSTEPLLRFPFIHSLANPCNFALDIVSLSPFPTLHNLLLEEKELNQLDLEEQHLSPVLLRNLSANEEIPLAQQALDFLGPYRDLIDVKPARNVNNKQREEQSSLIKEFKLVVSQTLHLFRRNYSPSTLEKCTGFQLQSLPKENLSIASSTGEIHLKELYRSLLIATAHLHVIISDVRDSARFCPTENTAHLQILRQLIGKVETSMCLVLHSAVITKHEENVDYFRVAHEVLQSFMHRYYSCSAREVRECLVMNFTRQIFRIIQRYIND